MMGHQVIACCFNKGAEGGGEGVPITQHAEFLSEITRHGENF